MDLEDTKGEKDKRDVEKIGVCGWMQAEWIARVSGDTAGGCASWPSLAYVLWLSLLPSHILQPHHLPWKGRPTRKRGLALPSQPSSPYRDVGTEPRGLRQNRREILGTECFKRNLGQQGAESLGDSLGILPGYHILQGKLMFPVRVLSLINERV